MSQDSELNRVRDTIGRCVIAFCEAQLAAGAPFRMEHLRDWVVSHGHAAPDSPGRILRDLRQRGSINYRVLSRSGSLYEVLPRAA